jgi:hypothetical protein
MILPAPVAKATAGAKPMAKAAMAHISQLQSAFLVMTLLAMKYIYSPILSI